MLEVEEHMAVCGACAGERAVTSAVKNEVKRQLVAAPAPGHLRARVLRAMDGVEADQDEQQSHGHMGVTLMAVAASVLLVLGSIVGTDSGHGGQMAGMTPRALDIVRDVVNRHNDQLPTEISTQVPEQATGWFRGKLSFRAQPVEFAEPSVRFVGGRISQVGENQAAKLYYAAGDHRLTVVMFKASPSMLEALRSERERQREAGRLLRVGGREITYHTLQGYTVPILEQDGIVYAFAGDFDQQKLLHLVGKARIPH
jgi:hypothetical protein